MNDFILLVLIPLLAAVVAFVPSILFGLIGALIRRFTNG